ncbi:MAG: acylphosphatase [Balneolaceae bacterium]
MSVKERHLFISGNVQGVGFRYFTKMNAKDLDITGWVRNLSDGRVEALFQGTENSILEMTERMQNGPRTAIVRSIEAGELKEPDEKFDSFFVKR